MGLVVGNNPGTQPRKLNLPANSPWQAVYPSTPTNQAHHQIPDLQKSLDARTQALSAGAVHKPSLGDELINKPIPPHSKVVTFDLDETLIACNKLTEEMKKKGQELGYKLITSKEGREYFLRPGAVDLLKWVKDQGFIVVVTSRNLHGYEEDLINSCELKNYIDHITGLSDLLDAENQNFDKFPNHPNRMGVMEKLTAIPKTIYKGIFHDFIGRGSKRLAGNKNFAPYMRSMPWKNFKYPPHLSGSHILVDNLYKENHAKSLQSKDWVALDPGQFDGDSVEQRAMNGDYQWAANIKDKLLQVKRAGTWKTLATDFAPIDKAVELAKSARENPKLKEIVNYVDSELKKAA